MLKHRIGCSQQHSCPGPCEDAVPGCAPPGPRGGTAWLSTSLAIRPAGRAPPTVSGLPRGGPTPDRRARRLSDSDAARAEDLPGRRYFRPASSTPRPRQRARPHRGEGLASATRRPLRASPLIDMRLQPPPPTTTTSALRRGVSLPAAAGLTSASGARGPRQPKALAGLHHGVRVTPSTVPEFGSRRLRLEVRGEAARAAHRAERRHAAAASPSGLRYGLPHPAAAAAEDTATLACCRGWRHRAACTSCIWRRRARCRHRGGPGDGARPGRDLSPLPDVLRGGEVPDGAT
jgi:hypothetical protein